MVRIRQKNWYKTIKNRSGLKSACCIDFICNFASQVLVVKCLHL